MPLVAGLDAGRPLLRNGQLVRALACGFFLKAKQVAMQHELLSPSASARMQPRFALDGRTWTTVTQETGSFDLGALDLAGTPRDAGVYLSFWISSPRSLDDLLLEPDLPRIDLQAMYQGDSIAIYLNRKQLPLIGDARAAAHEPCRQRR